LRLERKRQNLFYKVFPVNEQATAISLYKKLLACYPQAFHEKFAESMEQTFKDLCNEKKCKTNRGLFGFVL